MAYREITIVWGDHVTVDCCWAISSTTKGDPNNSIYSQVVDVFFSLTDNTPSRHANVQGHAEDTIWLLNGDSKPQSVDAGEFGSTEAFQFLISCLRASESSGNSVARLVIPLEKGTIVRSDIIPLRLKDAIAVEKVVSFSTPLQSFSGALLQTDTVSLPELFHAAAGGILLQHSALDTQGKPGTVPPAFETDFEKKLSTPWITTGPQYRKRLVVVGCSARDPASGGWMAYVFSSAHALGIDLVIIDLPGNKWFERPEHRACYEALLPADSSWWSNPPGPDMAEHIIALVRAYDKKVDGIVAFLEPFLATVSRAAEQLGLPHQPAEAYEIATDKYRLGVSEGRAAFCGETAEEALDFATREKLEYPLILKPRLGLNSEGVVRVDSSAEIGPAVDMIRKTFCKSFTMERYCDGPEVDVNIVLLDGEVLFCEIADDFPKPGDFPGGNEEKGGSNNFLETYIVYPSALPPLELAMLRDNISATIRRLGFSSGIMHVEARVDRSSVEYRSSGSGIVDLAPFENAKAQPVSEQPPTPWVLEINPRPPGLTASRIIESVYGIDYFGVALALAVDDKDRVRALAQPFIGGAQYTGVMALIRADYDDETCEGIFDSDDICEELLVRRPDLAEHINRYGCLAKRGQKIPHPSSGANTFVAYFNVFSKSRKEALEVAAEVKREVRYSFR